MNQPRQEPQRQIVYTLGMQNLTLPKSWKLTVLIVLCCSAPAYSVEPARAFLDGLRARGMQDIAIDYLDQMQDSRLAPPEIRDAILYEKSLALIDLSRTQRDSNLRTKQINQAQKLLQQFISTKASSPKANAARSQLGNLLVERARMKSNDAKQGNNKKLQNEALALYKQSFKVFSDLQSQVDKQLAEIPKVLDKRDRKQAVLVARRKQLRADFLQTELFAAAVREELADQLPVGSPDQTKMLSEAATMYEGIYKKYRTRLAGLYARMYQGRCNRRLGKTKDALGYFTELLDQPNEPESMLLLKSKALRMAMETWVSPAENKYMEAIKRATEWFDESPRGRERDPDWLAIQYQLGKAYKLQADDAKRTEPVDRRLIAQSIEAAKQELTNVARESGEFQEPAQKLLSQLGGPDIVDDEPVIDNFEAAQAAGKEALDAIGALGKKVQQLNQQITAEKDATKKAALQEKLTTAEQEFAKAQTDAVDFYRLAIELADDSTPQSSVNLAQYFLCYVYYVRQDYLHAALVGDFVARRYPQSPGARQCAKITMACYLKLAEENTDDQAFEIERLTSVGRYLQQAWPKTPDTQASLASLIPVLINAGEVLVASEFLQHIPETSPQRGELELVTGQSIWGAYLAGDGQLRKWRQSSVPDDVDLSEFEQKQSTLRESASKILRDGFKRLPAEPAISTANATALLSLAQVHVENGEFADAITVVEHPKLGPLTLVRQSSDVVSNPIFIEETYRTALRSYVASLASGDEAMIEKAKTVMSQMQAALGSNEAGKKRMLGIYVSLAQDIEKGMKSASPEARQKMSGVFEAFLLELSEGSNELSVLNWTAETFASLGAGLEDGDAANPDAVKYYQRSVSAFENILKQTGLSPEMRTQANARLAEMSAKSGDRDKALQLYKDLLTAKPSAINVQVATAELLQQWGSEDPAKYNQAISGIKNGNNTVVWGWNKIALTAARHKQFRQTFFQSRLQIAKCQFLLANTKSGAEKTKLIASAEKTLVKTAGLYPTLGGPEKFAEYDVMLKEIQKAAGKSTSGLTGLGLTAPNQNESKED